MFEILSERNLDKHGLINKAVVRCVLEEHFSNREIHDTLIWALVVFQKWYELYMEAPAGNQRQAGL